MITNQTRQTWMKILGVALLAISLPVFAQPQGPDGKVAGRPGNPDRPGAAFGPGGPGGPGGFGQGFGRGFGRFGRLGGPDRPEGRFGEIAKGLGGPEGGKGVMMAHWEGKGRKGGHHPSAEMLLAPGVREKLGLTDDQVKKIQDIVYNTKKQEIELKAKLEQAELDMKRLIQDKRADRAKVLAQVDTIAQAKTALARQKVTGLLDVRDVLNDKQLDQIHKFIQERHARREMMGRPGAERMRERFKERGGPGGPGFGRMRGPWGQGGPGGPGAQKAPTPPTPPQGPQS